MAKRANLTAAELDQIAQMVEVEGLGDAVIAKRLGCSVGSVGWAKLRIGADRHPTKALPPVPIERITAMRGGKPIHRFTAADDAELCRLEAEDLTYSEIGRRLNPPRLPNSVKGRLMTLARRAAREEAACG